jgi:TPR repeat protein
MYERGWGVPQDDREALRLSREAADRGSDQCLNNVGVFYRDGRGGVQRDLVWAYVWFSLADRAKIPQARAKAEDARRSLSPTQITEAERRIAAWKVPLAGLERVDDGR